MMIFLFMSGSSAGHFTMSPCLAMLLAPRELRTDVLPGLDGDPAQLADDLLRYALAGLDAMARHYQAP
jgi:hypothetical protein